MGASYHQLQPPSNPPIPNGRHNTETLWLKLLFLLQNSHHTDHTKTSELLQIRKIPTNFWGLCIFTIASFLSCCPSVINSHTNKVSFKTVARTRSCCHSHSSRRRQRQWMRNAAGVGYYWSFAPSPPVSVQRVFISFPATFQWQIPIK